MITSADVASIYELPLGLHAEGLDEQIIDKLNMWTSRPDLSKWKTLVERIRHPSHQVRIALVGKYVDLREAYKSLSEAIIHGGIANDCKVEIDYVDSEELEKAGCAELDRVAAVLVAGGFGSRGASGKIEAIRYARERRVPFLGICLGMQMAVVEFARHVCELPNAQSQEFVPESGDHVIHLMEDQKGKKQKGGSMRLGAYPCKLLPGSMAERIYRAEVVHERHRHRFEVNNRYRECLEQHGLVASGLSPDGRLVEMIELPSHPFFVGCQFHPEFKSKPLKPHPLFQAFIAAALAQVQAGSAEESSVVGS